MPREDGSAAHVLQWASPQFSSHAHRQHGWFWAGTPPPVKTDAFLLIHEWRLFTPSPPPLVKNWEFFCYVVQESLERCRNAPELQLEQLQRSIDLQNRPQYSRGRAGCPSLQDGSIRHCRKFLFNFDMVVTGKRLHTYMRFFILLWILLSKDSLFVLLNDVGCSLLRLHIFMHASISRPRGARTCFAFFKSSRVEVGVHLAPVAALPFTWWVQHSFLAYQPEARP